MGNTESLLINITTNLTSVDQDLEALFRTSEYENKRKQFEEMKQDILHMNRIILKELDSVYDDETYTGVSDRI